MKIITIYTTAVKVPEGFMIAPLLEINGFEELLNNDLSPERERELIDACQKHGIDIHHVVAPDGFTNEKLINKKSLAIIIEAARKFGEQYIDAFSYPLNEFCLTPEDIEKVSKIINTSTGAPI